MRREGFTLVELTIVVAILGILAAIVLPTFQGHAAEAKVSSAKSDLRAMRTQIELYKMQHNGTPPGTASGSVVDVTVLEQQFIGTSTADGAASSSKAPADPYVCGPYLMKIPANPFNNKSNIAYSTAFAGDAGVVNSGWLYNATTGEICLNYPGTDPDGVAYTAY